MGSRNYYNSVKAKGDVYFKPSKSRAKNEHDVSLKILINESSASASMTLIANVRYSGFGEIIGQPSGQSPNFCANAVRFQLDNSGIIYNIPVSYGYYMDGDKKADNIIIPDIVVPFTEDALDYVKWD